MKSAVTAFYGGNRAPIWVLTEGKLYRLVVMNILVIL